MYPHQTLTAGPSVQQAQGPEFKPQYCQKTKERKKRRHEENKFASER
jgi:hypothetical protein